MPKISKVSALRTYERNEQKMLGEFFSARFGNPELCGPSYGKDWLCHVLDLMDLSEIKVIIEAL